MFRIALELSIPKIGLNITLSLTVKKLDAFKLTESRNLTTLIKTRNFTASCIEQLLSQNITTGQTKRIIALFLKYPKL